MTERTSVTTDASGRRVLAKLAGNAEEAARLQREAAQLEAARHPGVVELVGVDGHGVGSIMLTAHVEGPTLAELGHVPLEEAAGLLAALASTLGDIHGLGLVHGAVAPEHVIVGPGGRPVLCSLSYGGRTGEAAGPAPSVLQAFADPARAGAETLSPAVDVFALGVLARSLAPDPPPGHVLAKVAEDCTAADPTGRGSARAVAYALHQQVPGARLPRSEASHHPQPPPRAEPAPTDLLAAWRRGLDCLNGPGRSVRPRAKTIAAVLVAVGAVVAAVALAGSSAAPPPTPVGELAEPAPQLADPPPTDEGQPGPTTTRARLAPSSTTTTAVAPRSDCPPATGVLQADVDGDGCTDALRYAGGILETPEARWSLGQAGDQVATGDWACQGSRTLALFRPSTGEIFRFEGWAGPGKDLAATAVARVPGGHALRAADVDRDGCHEAVVERGTGVADVVRLPAARP